jgi:hypothetical protein
LDPYKREEQNRSEKDPEMLDRLELIYDDLKFFIIKRWKLHIFREVEESMKVMRREIEVMN